MTKKLKHRRSVPNDEETSTYVGSQSELLGTEREVDVQIATQQANSMKLEGNEETDSLLVRCGKHTIRTWSTNQTPVATSSAEFDLYSCDGFSGRSGHEVVVERHFG